MLMQQVDLNGLKVYPFKSVDQLIDFADERKGILVAINAEKIINANPVTLPIINSNIGYCDGGGATLACKQAGHDGAARIPGCELWLEIIRKLHSDHSFYLIGAKPDVIEDTVKKLREDFPEICIKGYRDGYIKSDEERSSLIDDIALKRPDVVFVAMGSPKQEVLMSDMAQRHKAIYQGLGGSFDVYTGRQKRAPEWWRNHNCEFLYRLITHPKRLLRNTAQARLAVRLLLKKYRPKC